MQLICLLQPHNGLWLYLQKYIPVNKKYHASLIILFQLYNYKLYGIFLLIYLVNI